MHVELMRALGSGTAAIQFRKPLGQKDFEAIELLPPKYLDRRENQ